MTLNTFVAFLTVVEEMNFTKAAQRLYVTQQSLSGQIKRLEEEFGVTLFERRPTLRLTPEEETVCVMHWIVCTEPPAFARGLSSRVSGRM